MVVSLAALIIGAGYLGPHPAPHPTSSPAPSLFAGKQTPAPFVEPGPHQDALPGLTQIEPRPGQIKETWLPGQITSASMAVLGVTLFFIVDGNRIESTDIGGDGSRQTLAEVPACQGINQLAAAGNELAYVVTSPGGPTAQVHDCGGGGSVSWSVWLLDLSGGNPRRVEEGTRAVSSIEVAEFPIHLAITESAYALDRPPASAGAGAGDDVEVHALDGRLLWTRHTLMPVSDLLLADRTLAVLTDDSAGLRGTVDLFISDEAQPGLTPVGQLVKSAALSSDGQYLAWDAVYQGRTLGPNPPVGVGIKAVESGIEDPILTLTDRTAPAPLRPAVTSTSRGPLVTWFATATDGAIYPAVRYAKGGNGAYLPSPQEPVWMSAQDGMLFWVSEGAGGWSKIAFAVDFTTLGLR